ncbi:phosphoribosyltransferase family protein [Rossellomorea marisflavi]|uniref:phosphoribosyltransferase family protein n=1 Tax=Rossellomorea marisflavi TaxID=189381 RepID=UPI003D28F12F
MEVKTLDNNTFEDYCVQFATRIHREFKPDLIIGIKNGGAIVAKEMLKHEIFNDVEYDELILQRTSTKAKNKFKISSVLKLLPYSITNYFRIVESVHNEKIYMKERKRKNLKSVVLSQTMSNKIKKSMNILVIDDAVDSGRTMLSVKRAFENINSNLTIKTAAITVTYKEPLLNPEFYMENGVLIRFPWSNDYKKG